ncbi:MAG TPA: DUF4139 domain-containing protein [Steroidobacter sp.]|uniref:DUF4139 domain-containing protein n=1 Tax=Steroidobacter sp. TaxID=1978227 RepID=UPI002EDB1701
MRAQVAIAIAVTAVASTALATEAPTKLSLTIYNKDLALIEEIRSLDPGKGRHRIEFKDVSASIRPETVVLSAPDVSIVEQNFDYDLLTPEKLMQKAVGQEVEIVRVNPGSGEQVREKAAVLAANEGVVLRIGNNIEVLRADGVPTRVIFPKVPDNLRARPTLSVTVQSEKAGTRDMRLSYLSKGLSWKSDYVALFDEKAGKLDMQGWITLTNTSGSAYANADTQLVAGDINLAGEIPAWQLQQQQLQRQQARQMRQAGRDPGPPPQLADYYVYPIRERTTIADNQTKQVGYLDVNGVAARKVYRYRASWFQTSEPTHVDVAVDFTNSKDAGLGAQLPAGVVRVYVRDVDGKPKFVGEDQIPHTPRGSELSVKTGEAFDVTVEATLERHESVSLFRSRYAMLYTIRNARSQPVTVSLRQDGLWRDGRVLEENLKSTNNDARSLQWDVPVPANGETRLRFTVETGW